MDDIHEVLTSLTNQQVGSILATIVDVKGSAYKKEGAMMLFKPDGSQIGMLSAGCLEVDLVERITRLGIGKEPELITYDMRADNDLLWGQGSGCNGVIQVLVEPVDHVLLQHLYRIKKALDNGQKVLIYKELPTENKAMNYWFQTNGAQFGKVNENSTLNQLMQSSNSFTRGTQKMTHSQQAIYFDCYQPKPRLIVIGAGDDAKPIVRLASETGFRVEIADWREELCNTINFPEANKHYLGFPKELQQQISFHTTDYVILLTHNFQRDKELLSFLIEEPLRYLGVLGSARRTKRLLAGQRPPKNLFSPIGININAESANEIAVSVMAELIQEKKKMLKSEEVVDEIC
ncbi:XdhC family protein [Gracilibacillus lacisalsi]|uniref:XdhC family protein n=1 Tax=Gracilibacillus lacisalsi TaxID=393087 RepID=UPI00036259CA|nr:XdhC family protein [Gracilibacillus lacisalsi]